MESPIPLFSPNNLPIVAMAFGDGSVSTFEFRFCVETQMKEYTLPNGSAKISEKVTLVDSAGQHWETHDVEWHTLFEKKTK